MREKILKLPIQDNKIFKVVLAGITYPDRGYFIKRPPQDLWVFETVVSGCGTVCIEDQKFQVTAGDTYILPAHTSQLYYSDPENPFEKIWFNLSGTLVDSLVQAYGLEGHWYLPQAGLEAEFRRYLELLGREQLTLADISNAGADGFHRLIRKIAATLPAPQNDPASVLKKYIDEHIEQHFELKELAHLIYHSPSQTIRIFKTAYGKTPYDYILDKKLERACMLLSHTNLMVKEIAAQLQFADEHYFSTTFKKRIGLTPRQYKKTV